MLASLVPALVEDKARRAKEATEQSRADELQANEPQTDELVKLAMHKTMADRLFRLLNMASAKDSRSDGVMSRFWTGED